MSFRKILLAVMAAFSLAATGAHAQTQTEIQWWHSMTGALGDRVNELANKFNASQKDYKVVPVYKGTYPESMTAAVAAFRAGNAPHILQVFEVGTATMMAAKGAVVPVAKLMKDADEPFDPKVYVPTVAGYYTDSKGDMLSFPFNSSTIVYYINKDAFKKAGLDPDKAPKTWKELNEAADKIKASGQACVYTTGWPSWMNIENFSAWHNVPIGTKDNGMAGIDTQFTFNSPLHVKHLAMLGEMSKKGTFTYAGRTNQAEAKFYSGECAMMTTSSAAYGTVKQNAKFKFGIAPLPYYADVTGAPQNTIIGGASLWVMGGKSKDEYKAVAKFLSFLSKPEIQAEFHQASGYLPITMAAYDLTQKSGFYEKNPGTDVSVKQMIVKTTDKSRGIRLGNYLQIRTIIDEELEDVWNGKKTAQAALDSAVARGNEQIAKFARTAKE